MRVAVGVTATIHAGTYLSSGHATIVTWIIGVLVIASGVLVLMGFLTPITGALLAITMLASVFPLAVLTPNFLAAKSSQILAFTMATAVVFLGPGAFSLDARLFGRREVIIPPSSHSSES